ncbi:multidrug transporter [Cupriavidus sp. SHE]|uniref:HlyD family efflux transporter periplasmic adaptor subunit n=1 Tax=Cupriavidus metallidurans TaxID=119219 RepID=A0A482J2P8_9BURK|nr:MULTISPECIES: HlyD family efflux transporter periplasmic adaptor subunit [Cupriavidus]KWR83792.1 multidrug transporter [Cupriavidus sp. SHE]QBP13354.1 HlyD family efflux transporter periplasmic adaptor subunit [Cupriavidus metallidurans]
MQMPTQSDVVLLLQLAELESLARQADSVQQLSFHIANDAHPLLRYRQALVFDVRPPAWHLLNISGLVSIDEQSPYVVWLGHARKWLRERLEAGEPQWITQEDAALASDVVRSGWEEWWPNGAWALPLRSRAGQVQGWVLFLLDEVPGAGAGIAMSRLTQAWGYHWEMLARRERDVSWLWGSRTRRIAIAAVVLILLMPVRQSALAPAEVTSLDLQMVSAPIEGVVKEVHVQPNQTVKAGQPLFSLDDTTLSHRLEVASQAVAVADAELLAARQNAFRSDDSKAQLTTLQSRAEERRAELESIRSQLQRQTVVAPRDGVAVFADINDWLGKPVVTGERIMQLANPDRPAMLIHLPVADALTLDVGAPVSLFLTVRPLQPLSGKLIETSYQAALTPDGVPSYRLRADIENGDPQHARIGLKGTARIKGGWSVLAYEILRRPLATLRAWTGI